MRVAFVGAGPRALSNAAALARAHAGTTVGFWDRSPARSAVAGTMNRTRSFGGISEMVAETQPDVVAVATHPSYRSEAIGLAVQAGARIVAVEKPIALDEAELRRVEDAAADALLVVNTQYPWMPHWQHVFAAIAADEFGTIRSIHASTRVDAMDQGPHLLSLAFAATRAAGIGESPDWVLAGASGQSRYGNPRAPAEINAVFGVGPVRVGLLTGDAAPVVVGESNLYYQQQVEIVGSAGSASVTLSRGGVLRRGSVVEELDTQWPRDDDVAQGAFWHHLAKAAVDPASARQFPSRLSVAAIHARALLGTFRSAAERRRIDLF